MLSLLVALSVRLCGVKVQINSGVGNSRLTLPRSAFNARPFTCISRPADENETYNAIMGVSNPPHSTALEGAVASCWPFVPYLQQEKKKALALTSACHSNAGSLPLLSRR